MAVLKARAEAGIRRFEHKLGVVRPDRSPWIWLVPVIEAIATFLVIVWVSNEEGDLSFWAKLPLGIVGALVVSGMSAAYIVALGQPRDEDG